MNAMPVLTPSSGSRRGPMLVPACRCYGRCHCGGLVQELLLERLERECEFYRSEW